MQVYYTLSRLLRTTTLLVFIFLAFLITACGGSNDTAPDAHQLITKAQAAIQKVTSYHFNLAVDNPGTGGILPIKSADGDVLVPDKLKANATAILFGSVVQVQIISVKDKQYFTNPVTGSWQRTTGLLDPRTLSDPQIGVAAILGHIQNPTTPQDDNVNGTSCWRINGKIDPTYFAGITGGGAPAGTMDDVTTCIGKSDNLPYLIRISGIAAAGDSAKTVRTFKLSKFGENLTITAPV